MSVRLCFVHLHHIPLSLWNAFYNQTFVFFPVAPRLVKYSSLLLYLSVCKKQIKRARQRRI